MATEADHLKLANKNHDVLLHLLKDVDRFPEWVTVTAFYKAVQIVEAAYRHTYGECSHGHQKRLDALKSRGHAVLYKHFRSLWGVSSVARYFYDTASGSPYSSFSVRMPTDKVKRFIKKRLSGVECEAASMLSEAGKQQLIRLPDEF